MTKSSTVTLLVVLLARTATAQPAGSDFRVNSETTGSQAPNRGRTVAAAGNGDFVIVWQGRPGGSGTTYDIYGQRFNSLRQPDGPQFRVNTFTTYQQLAGTVAADRRGNFVVVWTSSSLGGGADPGGIKGQRFASTGEPLGDEFRANTLLTGGHVSPAIAMDETGNFIVVWSSGVHDGSGFGVFGQRYDGEGVPQGGQFQVNTFTTGAQSSPTVAVDGEGRFVVAWTSYGQDGSDLGIFAQRYDSLGAPQGAEFRVNTYTEDRQYHPSVAAAARGDFVVAWASRGQDGSSDGVFAQRFDADGAPLGNEFRVNTSTASQQGQPFVGSDDRGNFTITWESFGTPTGDGAVFARRYHYFGEPRGPEFRVDSSTVSVIQPSIGSDTAGNPIVVWGAPDGDFFGIFARRLAGLPHDPSDAP